MKKLLLVIAVLALVCTIVSCGNDDPSNRSYGERTVSWPMVNHMYNTVSGEVIGMGNARNKLVIDIDNGTASVELTYNDGTEHVLTLTDLTATAKRLLFYELRSPSDASFYGYVDFSEGSVRYRYTTADGVRVISMTEEVFFFKTHNSIEYSDSTPVTVMENVGYQFDVDPASLTAVVKVSDINHAKDLKFFSSITGMNVPFTLTSTGFVVAGQNIKTVAYYDGAMDTTGNIHYTTTDYPFMTFNATVDLLNDHLDAHFMMGDDATVTATGKTYPDYSAN